MLSSSDAELGTLRTIILFPSVDPIPIEAKDLVEVASSFPVPISLKTNELVRPIPEALGKFSEVC